MTGLIFTVTFFSFLSFVEGVRRWVNRPHLSPKAQVYGTPFDEKPLSFFERHILPFCAKLPPYFGALRSLGITESTTNNLMYAGHPYGMTTEAFFGVQLFYMLMGVLLMGGAGMGLGRVGYMMGLTFPILGFILPALVWLKPQAQKRQLAITLALPDLLDLLAISLKAGIGFDQALGLIITYMTGPLRDEVVQTLTEIDLGSQRETAFRDLITRNNSEDLRIFMEALIIAEQLGTPISKILEDQSEDMVKRRMSRAKEKANKASPKMSMVVTFIIAPSALLIFIGVIVLNLLKDLGSVFGG